MAISRIKKKYFFCFAIVFFIPIVVFGMESSNYKIEYDVLSSGGGEGDSESYILRDTIGEAVVGPAGSETYSAFGGFWHGLTTSIYLSLDADEVNLGNIVPGNPITGQTVITVKTDAWNGYNLQVEKNAPLTHTDSVTSLPDYSCSIGAPCSWSGNGLGFSVISGTNVDPKWGSEPDYKYAFIPNNDVVFHQKYGFKAGEDETIVRYKLDAPVYQKSGIYTNNITFTAMENL